MINSQRGAWRRGGYLLSHQTSANMMNFATTQLCLIKLIFFFAVFMYFIFVANYSVIVVVE